MVFKGRYAFIRYHELFMENSIMQRKKNKIFEKKKYEDGTRKIYCCGSKIFFYNGSIKQTIKNCFKIKKYSDASVYKKSWLGIPLVKVKYSHSLINIKVLGIRIAKIPFPKSDTCTEESYTLLDSFATFRTREDCSYEK